MSPTPIQSRTTSRAPEHVSGASASVLAHEGQSLVALVGNPNCGKSTLFNVLTGGTRAVGNWAGVTVDSGFGTYAHGGVEVGVVDLPGVYSLAPSTVDELVTREFVASHRATLLVNVLDASNLERNLYLTMQLAELGVPMVVALNMGDTAAEAGTIVDPAELSTQLGCPVVEVCAARRTGIEALRAAIFAASANPAVPSIVAPLDPIVESHVELLSARIDPDANGAMPARWIATRLFEFDRLVEEAAGEELLSLRDASCHEIEAQLDEEVDILIADARYERIGRLIEACVHHRGRIGASRTERLDHIALHPRFGIPVFLGVMYVMFLLTITIGSAFIDVFDQLGGLLFVDIPAAAMHAIGLPEGLVVLLANGLGGGLQSVATFIPPVGIMFLCLRMLEESGYMARAAFVMDRFMRGLGLPGKAFVPMIVGFGCNVPAIMGARTLERERDRKMAVALNPFMSCGARLPVYALFAATFFPSSGQMVVFALYLIGIAFAVMTGLILKRTVLTGELTPFVMELPPYHRPSMASVLRGAWARLRGFLIGAGRIIVPVVAALTVLGSMGTDGTFGNDNSNSSVLSAIGQGITPAFAPIGIEQDNWQATVGMFTGIFAKEAVVGTLDALYSQAEGSDAPAADEPLDVGASTSAAFMTVPANLVDASRSLVDPLGLSVGTIDDPAAAAAEQGVDKRTFDAMYTRFDGQVGAFAYLLFILLYLPCVAATAAIYRETGRSWAIFVGCWTTGLAFMAATVFYQLATFAQHPASSLAWIVGLAVVFALVVRRMRRWSAGDERPREPGPAPRPIVTTSVVMPREAESSEATPGASDAPAPTPARPTSWPTKPMFDSRPVFRRPAPDAAPPASSAPRVAVRPQPTMTAAAARTQTATRINDRPVPAFTRADFLQTGDEDDE